MTPRPAAIRAIILDWAGTTVDFGSCAPARVFVRVFADAGVTISDAEARAPMGFEKRDHIRALLDQPAIAARWRAAHGRAADEAAIDRLYDAFLPLQLAVVGEHAEPIAGVVDAIAAMRARGLAIGSDTGYARAIMDLLAPAAAAKGYRPDVIVTADEVPAGRPAPFMAWRAAERLGVFPASACVKVDDTISGVAAGINAGMWSVGVALTGNEIGMDLTAWQALDAPEQARLAAAAHARLTTAGAHLVVDGVADLPAALDRIQARMAAGERP
jgi:phosphonoacetaldehyde hydrolase